MAHHRGWMIAFLCGLAAACSATTDGPGSSPALESNVGDDEVPAPLGSCGFKPKGPKGPNVEYLLVYQSPTTHWCVDRDVWNRPGKAELIGRFFGYGDQIYSKMQTLFGMPLEENFVFMVWDSPYLAQAGTHFGLGVAVDDTWVGDAFSDPVTLQDIPSFWGYLLLLHESINIFTGLVSANWPTDWWADHRSPFPNFYDAALLHDIGIALGNQTLVKAGRAQLRRFTVAGGADYDSEVPIFQELYVRYDGDAAFIRTFELMKQDGIQWSDVSPNPSELLTEYVIAYLHLGSQAKTDLTQSLFVEKGVGSLDTKIAHYEVSSDVVRAVATAHCSIRAAAKAGKKVSAELQALRTGQYRDAVASGGSQSGCPTECSWSSAESRCVASF